MADEDGLMGLADEAEGEDDNTTPPGDHPAHTTGTSANPADTAENPPEDPPKDGEDAEPGERPETVPEQFWDAEKGEVKTDDLAKSYSELRTAFNKLQNDKGDEAELPETAEGYLEDFELQREIGEGDDKSTLERVKDFEADDPALVAAAAAAKSAGLSKEQFGDFVTNFLHGIDMQLEKPLDMDAEVERLGGKEKATVIASANQMFLNGLQATGKLNEDQVEFAKNFAKSAVGLSTLNVLRGLAGEKPIPADVNVGDGAKSEAEVQAMMDDERYHKDGAVGDAYRAEVEIEIGKLNALKKAASGS